MQDLICPARTTRPAVSPPVGTALGSRCARRIPAGHLEEQARQDPRPVKEPESSEGRRCLSPTKVQVPFLRNLSQRREMLKLPTALPLSLRDHSGAHHRAPPGPREGGDGRTPPAACWDLRRGEAGEALGPQAEAPGCPTCAGCGSPHMPPAPLALRSEPSHPRSSHCRDPSVLSPCPLDCSMGGKKWKPLSQASPEAPVNELGSGGGVLRSRRNSKE